MSALEAFWMLYGVHFIHRTPPDVCIYVQLGSSHNLYFGEDKEELAYTNWQWVGRVGRLQKRSSQQKKCGQEAIELPR